MYYDDPYDPNAPNDYDDDDGPLDVASVIASSIRNGGSVAASTRQRTRHQTKLEEEYKKMDPGYRKLTIYENGSNRKKQIDCYHTSSTPGATIRDAITGSKNKGYKVGTSSEKLFFKAGCPGVDPNGCILFFDNPEQYERHFNCNLNNDIKEKWMTNYKIENASRIRREEERDQTSRTVIH